MVNDNNRKCTINTIKTLCPTGSSDTITSGSSCVGGIIVGVVSSAFVIVIPVMVMAVVRKKKRAKEDNTIKYNNGMFRIVLYMYIIYKNKLYDKNHLSITLW